MPNHVHVSFVLHPEWTLEKVLFTWKRRSAGAINTLRGKADSVWQHDYFDRLVRDEAHMYRVIGYIRRNPIKAGLRADEFTLWESEYAQAVR